MALRDALSKAKSTNVTGGVGGMNRLAAVKAAFQVQLLGVF
jgi:hypothetical protein